MSFDIQLMKNNDELNKISKSPVLIRTLTGTLRKETSIVDPIIMIEFDGALTDCNYAYIPTFNRYYFITDISSVRTKLWRIAMHCDVLKTYSNGILGSTAVIARQENQYNLYLNDNFYKCYQKSMIVNKTFPRGFTNQAFVLAMMGSQGSQNGGEDSGGETTE